MEMSQNPNQTATKICIPACLMECGWPLDNPQLIQCVRHYIFCNVENKWCVFWDGKIGEVKYYVLMDKSDASGFQLTWC